MSPVCNRVGVVLPGRISQRGRGGTHRWSVGRSQSEHPRNQVRRNCPQEPRPDAARADKWNIRGIKSVRATQPALSAPTNGTCAESSRDEDGSCGCFQVASAGWCTKGAGESREADLPCRTTRAKVDPDTMQVTIQQRPGPSFRSARCSGAPARHRAGVGRSIPRDPLLHPAGPRALHRRGTRRDEPVAACTGSPSGWRSPSIVSSAARKVVGDRYHVRPLTTPRQMRTSMVYVLLNFRKHLGRSPASTPESGPHSGVAPSAGDHAGLKQPRLRPRGWRPSVGSAPAVSSARRTSVYLRPHPT
jgi:hypothetical protein